MLPSRMPEFFTFEKRVGLHYTQGRNCFIDPAELTLHLPAISHRISPDLRKLQYCSLKDNFMLFCSRALRPPKGGLDERYLGRVVHTGVDCLRQNSRAVATGI